MSEIDLARLMYGGKGLPGYDKNPNRVVAGLRASGTNSRILTIGNENIEIPTVRYIEALEHKIKLLNDEIHKLRREIRRTAMDLEQTKQTVVVKK